MKTRMEKLFEKMTPEQRKKAQEDISNQLGINLKKKPIPAA